MVNMREPEEKAAIPKEHKFIISNINNQTLSVFSQNKGENDLPDGKKFINNFKNLPLRCIIRSIL